MNVSVDRIVRVQITRATRTLSRRGFGTVMIAAYHTAWPDRVRTYADPAEMLADGFTATHPAYLAAVALMSQEPSPDVFKVGRRAGAPSQSIRLTPTNVAQGEVFSLRIGGALVSVTAAAGDAVSDVCDDLVAAINAAGFTTAVTAVDGNTHVDVTVDAAGSWFAYTALTGNLLIEDRTAEPATTLATDLAAIQNADPDWYGLVVADAQSSAQIAAAATWAETQVVLHAAHSIDSAVLESVTTDVASVLKAADRLRTNLFWSRANHGGFPNAALLGALFPLDIGSADYEYKRLAGVVADSLSTTEVERLLGTVSSPQSGKRATIYGQVVATGTRGGTPTTLGGLTSAGEWIDVVTGLDYVTALIQERTFNLRLSLPKVPFTDGGLDLIVGAVRSALNTTSAAPFNILDPASITVQAPTLADIDASDRAARYFNAVRFDARPQGSIRSIRVTGTVRP